MKQSRLQGVYLIDLPTFEDERGFFRETFRLNELEEAMGSKVEFVRLNHSRSKQNVLRGIHVANFEKLVYVPRGQATAVIIDCRPDSPTFKQHDVVELGDENRVAIYVPAGCGNSFYTKSEEADYIYLVTKYYNPADEKTIRWDDADLNIPWPTKTPIISDRDKNGQPFVSLSRC